VLDLFDLELDLDPGKSLAKGSSSPLAKGHAPLAWCCWPRLPVLQLSAEDSEFQGNIVCLVFPKSNARCGEQL
jgi:hypothetical protein